MNLLDAIQQDAHGAATLIDWLGEGGVPVDEFAARRRAEICLSCPKNQHGRWWEGVKNAIANAIKKQMAIKHKLELTVPYEDQLGNCNVCGCCIPLLIWCPDKQIRTNAAEPSSSYPDHCWKKTILET